MSLFNSPEFASLAGAVGNYYMGKEGIEGAYKTGQLGQQMSSELADELRKQSKFQPYSVVGRQGRVATGASGGVDFRTDMDTMAFQDDLEQQARDRFARAAGFDVQGRTGDIYDSIRATQRPEEQRQRLAMEERLLGQGRLGLQSNMFGGANPETFALEKARQEAMANASLAARDMAMQERQADYALGSGLLAQSYIPDEQMRANLQASIPIKQLFQGAQQAGTSLYGQAQGRGLESMLQGADLANRLELQRQQAMLEAFMPQQASLDDILRAKALGLDPSTLGGDAGLWSQLGFGDAETPQWIKDIGDSALRWLGLGDDEPTEDDSMSQFNPNPNEFDQTA